MKDAYKVKSLKDVPPILVTLEGDEFHEVFRVTRKQRPNVVAMLVNSAYLNEDGVRVFPQDTIRSAFLLHLAKELWDPTAPLFDEGGPVIENDAQKLGAWVAVDDQDRFLDLINSNRFDLTTQELGDVVWDLIEELTGHPMTAPRP